MIINRTERKAKSFLLICIFVIALSPVYSQTASVKNKLSAIEVTAGPALVSLRNAPMARDVKNLEKVGYLARLGLSYTIKKHLFFNLGLMVERKGAKSTFQTAYYDPEKDVDNCKCTTSLGTMKSDSNLDYITVSTIFRFNVLNTLIYFDAGPYVSYLLKAQTISTHLWDNSAYYTVASINEVV